MSSPMPRFRATPIVTIACMSFAAMLLAACGGGGSHTTGGAQPECASSAQYDGTFAAIQDRIFERHGCTENSCHGSSVAGGLDLRAEVAHMSLLGEQRQGQKSIESKLNRVEPGDNERSYLWLKLAAATRPGSVAIVGAPMPNGLAPLSEDDLELLRRWIYAGAPKTGTVEGTQDLIDACLPEVKPFTIEPLPPPARGDGVQFVLAPLPLKARSEREVCFATYYDFTDQVPADAKDPSGQYFRYAGQELRQDPQSHHLVLLYSGVPVEKIHDPAFGEWTCVGGEQEGDTCEPTDTKSCGSGICRSRVMDTVGCVGFGPPGFGASVFGRQIGGAQAPQAYQKLQEGVFAQIPLKGVLYWSPHAFNLTSEDFLLNGRLNFTFTRDARFPLVPIFNVGTIFIADAEPYTIETYCSKHLLARGTRLFGLTSHTHKRGKRFWVTGPDGTMLFENTIYSDPIKQAYDPPLEFDSPNPADRTLTYCATYNNGVAADGSPDPQTVTRASRVPLSARQTIGACIPVACAAGKIGAACNGENDDASCDSSPGAGDGDCDACRITGGESTENEMFILIGQAYIAEGYPQPDATGPLFGGLASIFADTGAEPH